MNWLDDALVVSPIKYTLCLTERSFRKALKRLHVPKDGRPEFLSTDHANAATHFFESDDGGAAVIVTLGGTEGRSIEQVHSLLVHEAVHLWQAIRERMGEESPSAEFEAYSVQAISQRLMESYAEQRKK